MQAQHMVLATKSLSSNLPQNLVLLRYHSQPSPNESVVKVSVHVSSSLGTTGATGGVGTTGSSTGSGVTGDSSDSGVAGAGSGTTGLGLSAGSGADIISVGSGTTGDSTGSEATGPGLQNIASLSSIPMHVQKPRGLNVYPCGQVSWQ